MRFPLAASLVLLALCRPVAADGAPKSLPELARFAAEATPEDGPALRTALARFADGIPESSEPALLLVLDALGRLGVNPTAAELRPLIRVKGLHLDAVAALAVRGRDEDLLLELYDRAEGRPVDVGQNRMSSGIWRAAGDRLAELRAPGFAARVLGRLWLHVEVRVADEPAPVEYPELDLGEDRPKGKFTVPDGYPPVPIHHLGRDGHTVEVLPPGEHELSFPPYGFDWHGAQVRWLATLLGRRETDLRPRTVVTLRYTSPEQFVVEATGARDAPAAAFWRTAKELIDRGLMTTGEARTIGPILEWSVADQREDSSAGFLPELPEPDRRCPFPLGPGPAPGTPPEVFTIAFAGATRAVVDNWSRKVEVGEPWLARFREALGPLGPPRFIPEDPTGEGEYGIDLPPADGTEVQLRLSFSRERASLWLDGRRTPGFWSFAKRRKEIMAALMEVFPPQRSRDPRWARLDVEALKARAAAEPVRVWCRRSGKTRPAPEGWGERFLEALGPLDEDRYYLSYPDGLFVGDYEVAIGPEATGWHPQDVGLTLCFDSGLVRYRRLDLGHPGAWTFGERREAVRKLIREVWPEDGR